jgi:hypothetical protein
LRRPSLPSVPRGPDVAKIFNLDTPSADAIFVESGLLPTRSYTTVKNGIGEISVMAIANLLGAYLALQVPEGGSPWMYLLLASAVCAGALVLNARKRTHGRSNA